MLQTINNKIKNMYKSNSNFCKLFGYDYKGFFDKKKRIADKISKINDFLNPLNLKLEFTEISGKIYIEYRNKIYYSYFKKEGSYGRIQTAQGENIAFAPLEQFKFPDVVMDLTRDYTESQLMDGILILKTK